MSILIDEKSRILVQGITGKEGLFHSEQMRKYGSNIVAGTARTSAKKRRIPGR